jgi:ribonucleotide reductase alpha subunit
MVKELKNKMIKIEDSIESMTYAMYELAEALKKGGGIGFDFSGIERKVAAE